MPCVIRRPAIGQSELTKSGSPSAMRANTGLPIFIDVAYAEGRLSNITCGLTPADNKVTIATRPGILNAWIGEVSNFSAVNDTPSVARA